MDASFAGSQIQLTPGTTHNPASDVGKVFGLVGTAL